MGRFSNISLSRYRRILQALGLTYVRTKGGHEMWFREGMLRNVVLQTHLDPVPERVVLSNLRTMGITAGEFERIMQTIK